MGNIRPLFFMDFPRCALHRTAKGNRHLSAALKGITAAVVGVMLNLALWFGIRVIFHDMTVQEWDVAGISLNLNLPVWISIDIATPVIASTALIAMTAFKIGMIKTLIASALMGMGLWDHYWRVIIGGSPLWADQLDQSRYPHKKVIFKS